jgi:hypothetical protein
MAGSFLNAASNLLGWGHSAGNSAYEIQRAVGGKAHDSALQVAVEEGKQHFHQCSRCGNWVCPEVCWNEKANQCEACAPDFQEQVASAQAAAKAEAVRQQLYQKAQETDYASGIDMSADSQVIRITLNNYAIAVSQALTRYSNDVIELLQTFEKFLNPSLINSLNWSRICGS